MILFSAVFLTFGSISAQQAFAGDPNPITPPGFYGSDRDGFIFLFDPSGPTITPIGLYGASAGSTEIECTSDGVDCFSDNSNGAFQIEKFNPAIPAALAPPVFDGGPYNGLEYVESTLFGIRHQASGGPALDILDPFTGFSVEIGPTNSATQAMSGLAYDTTNGIMYAVDGGGGGVNGAQVGGQIGAQNGGGAYLYTINLETGEASIIGNTGLGLGSLEFGPDGVLYAGGDNNEGGNIYSLDTNIGLATFVISSGQGSVTGLTLVDGIINEPIGGTSIPVSTTTLLVAGAQANMGLLSLALVGIVGAGAAITYKIKSKKTEQ